MAWRCSGSTNEALVTNLTRASILKTPRVIDAFRRVDRAYYVVDASEAYRDAPSYLGHVLSPWVKRYYGATISAPHMHAHAVENLEPFLKPGANVLDVGSGSGYLCGLFHSLVQPGGTVLGIDHLPELVTLARHNLARDPSAAAALCPDETSPVSEGNQEGGRTMQVITADGRNGAPKGQFMSELLLPAFLKLSSIRYASSTKRCYCSPLTFGDESARPPYTQLASPGRMFIPVGDFSQNIWQVDKDADGQVTKHRLFGVSYVPLTDAESQYADAR
ncbi:hypothetical protein C6P46_002616 [Rhodotorula mucilaginosa]|uniref:protein-L-isoaspartate(D-aspartate) O-methyltransferase n=1 Tax=Rhodotorula mucilaginosa TaxID=5537 RepID=A0A9P6WAE4_RHOMI|nr:hypothetical protein C6P46_002616 [Rhodotorula mucilaginosa]